MQKNNEDAIIKHNNNNAILKMTQYEESTYVFKSPSLLKGLRPIWKFWSWAGVVCVRLVFPHIECMGFLCFRFKYLSIYLKGIILGTMLFFPLLP